LVSHVFEVAKDYDVCKNFGVMAVVSVFSHRFSKRKGCLTKRAADGGYAPRFLAFFVALSFFRFDGESPLPPTAANADR